MNARERERNLDPFTRRGDLDGVKGTWFLWPRPERVQPADLPDGRPFEVTWLEQEDGEGYSIRSTPLDNDGVTLPTHVCSVAFITEDARTAALT